MKQRHRMSQREIKAMWAKRCSARWDVPKLKKGEELVWVPVGEAYKMRGGYPFGKEVEDVVRGRMLPYHKSEESSVGDTKFAAETPNQYVDNLSFAILSKYKKVPVISDKKAFFEHGFLGEGRHRIVAAMRAGEEKIPIKLSPRSLFEHEFMGIRGCGGFKANTEYELGIGRLAEEAHCVLGSLRRMIDEPGRSEVEHISEELGLIEKDSRIYSGDLYLDPTLWHNDETIAASVSSMQNASSRLVSDVARLKSEFKESGRVKDPLMRDAVEKTYDFLTVLGEEVYANTKDLKPNELPKKNVLKSYRIREAYEDMKDASMKLFEE